MDKNWQPVLSMRASSEVRMADELNDSKRGDEVRVTERQPARMVCFWPPLRG